MKGKGIIWLGAILGLVLIGGNTVLGDADDEACRKTARDVLFSSRDSADSDYWLALAVSENISDKAERLAARREATEERQDAKQTRREQYLARLEVCERLDEGRYDPVINPADFVAEIDNPFLPLEPGTTFVYIGNTDEGVESNVVAVTDNTREIMGVTCVEVRDTVTLDGELTEDTLDWFAQDTDGNVWYFGENSMEIEDGLVVSLEGSWTAGVDGAKPGIVMKANPAVGDFYRQEFMIGTAEDVAEVLSLTETVTVPYGSFSNCLQTAESSPIEPDVVEYKFYADGVGNVLIVNPDTGETSELVQITTE